MKKIKNALISVFYKDGLDAIVKLLDEQGVQIYSTGGSYDFIQQLGIKAHTVESLTSFPSILGGRVKTLHPLVFGGILGRRDLPQDMEQMQSYGMPEFDLVIVDLYPFEETLRKTNNEAEIIEKIDIGGISLIRAAAKNLNDVLIVPSVDYYEELKQLLKEKKGSDLEDRKRFAAYAFNVSSHYDTAIFNYFNREQKLPIFKQSFNHSESLRYGENPHQKANFFGDFNDYFEQLNGKEISYNNLLDIDAAVTLISDFSDPTFAVIKHTNACGVATRDNLLQAWKDALAGDPVSAFGGIIITNRAIDETVAEEINTLFCEVLIAPDFSEKALEILRSKKNRIILKRKDFTLNNQTQRGVLNGVLVQDRDTHIEQAGELKTVTKKTATEAEIEDLLFANKLVKHTKSNAIVLVKNKQLLASGTGQTSRVDALRQAIEKAHGFEQNLQGAVMASDAFFPFNDCVEIAAKAGITAVIQPGGSVKDADSVAMCDQLGISMVMTGIRHFKH